MELPEKYASSEGMHAAVLMRDLAGHKSSLPLEEIGQNRTPPCLLSVHYFCCKICPSEITFTSVSSFIAHVEVQHTGESSRICGYCGAYFQTALSLSMHQMSVPRTKCCSSCQAVLSVEALAKHLCKSNANSRTNCPLSCPTTRRFVSDDIMDHLQIFHGCDSSNASVIFNMVFRGITPDAFGRSFNKCDWCESDICTETTTILDHKIFTCPCRGPIAEQNIKSLLKIAEENDQDSKTLLRMEILAQANEWLLSFRTSLQESNQQSERAFYLNQQAQADIKYDLPPSFYKDYLSPVPDQVTLEELEEYVSDYESEDSFEILFEMWCQSLQKCFKSKDQDLTQTASELLGVVVEGLHGQEGEIQWREQDHQNLALTDRATLLSLQKDLDFEVFEDFPKRFGQFMKDVSDQYKIIGKVLDREENKENEAV